MARSRTGFIILWLFFSTPASAAVNRYVVFFKDKSGSIYSISNPQAFLSQRSIDRRTKQGIAVTELDFPVNQLYVDGVKATGAETFFTSRWMNALLIQCDESLLPSIEALVYVDHLDYVAPNAQLIGGRKKKTDQQKETEVDQVTDTQLDMIGINTMQQEGFRGEGMIIAVFDDGFPGVNTASAFQPIFTENRIDLITSTDFVYNSGNIFQYDNHGTEVFSVIAGFEQDVFTGGAYNATYQLYVTEDVSTEYRIEEYNWLFAAERADSAGADVINSSLGYYDFDDASMNYSKAEMDGRTAVVSQAAQLAAERGMVVVCSAGNEGNIAWQIITAPADAENVLAIASVNSEEVRSSSSSIGPSADGRIKPDVAALGVNTRVVLPNGALGFESGTSLSAPLITSLVAGVWQHFPLLSNTEIMDAIKKSSSQASAPDNLLGYGIPNYTAAIHYLEQQEQENIFDVFPNPVSSNIVSIRPFDPTEVDHCDIQFLNAQGQVVFAEELDFSWLNIIQVVDLTYLPSGVYILHITWNNKQFVYKLVKL